MKNNLGRPHKKQGVISFWNFQRAAIGMSFYDEARKNGQKHTAAIVQCVELIKQLYPLMRFSETEMRRILALWRPKGIQTILRFECTTLIGAELAKYCYQQSTASSNKKGLKLRSSADVTTPMSVTTFKIHVGERPNYPRHNRKLPK